MKINRRRFLGSLGAAGAATAGLGAGLTGLTVPMGRALASGGDGLRFLFVFNTGGWDPTHVFAPLFGNSQVDLELDAGQGSYGGIDIVEHATRPSVSQYFAKWADRTVLFNGVNVSSLSHEICTVRMLAGAPTQGTPDWATRVAYAEQESYTLPHLVLGGPSFAGNLGASVARTGSLGQLDGLLSGQLIEQGDGYAGRPSVVAERVLDRYLSRRSAARADAAGAGREAQLADGFDAALSRASGLKDVRYDMDFIPGNSLLTQGQAAADALSRGIARCVTIAHPGSWDTHAQINQQQLLFQSLFRDLVRIMDLLETTPGSNAATLADETVVVVMSEMGRTPKLNTANGKDHWPYTSVMVTGAGLAGGRVVGGWDDRYYGRGVDPSTGDVDDDAPLVSTQVLGATLMALADVDPGAELPGVDPIVGALA
jgi:hypothetical protein